MNERPKLASRINCTSICFCGTEKLPSDQWCPNCWDLMPTYSAMRYSRKAKDLTTCIESCNAQVLKMKKRESLDLNTQLLHGSKNESQTTPSP